MCVVKWLASKPLWVLLLCFFKCTSVSLDFLSRHWWWWSRSLFSIWDSLVVGDNPFLTMTHLASLLLSCDLRISLHKRNRRAKREGGGLLCEWVCPVVLEKLSQRSLLHFCSYFLPNPVVFFLPNMKTCPHPLRHPPFIHLCVKGCALPGWQVCEFLSASLWASYNV